LPERDKSTIRPTGAKGVSAGIAKLVVTDLKEYHAEGVEEIGDDADIEVL